MTPCRRVRNDQLATLKQHGGRRRRPSGLWSICVSGDRCGDAVGFSLSKGGNATDAGKRKGIGSASILPRSSWYWARAAPPTVSARTRIVSAAGIRLDHRKSVRSFKGIFCDDISEFESYIASQPVRSPPLLTKRRVRIAYLRSAGVRITREPFSGAARSARDYDRLSRIQPAWP
jgi:hypothetical protein